ncbi:MAG: elongation factor G [Caldicoprobacterales bacterium]|jgi:elongation factor G|nr:elongation factor G [Clostridiales bacterium]
MKNFETKKIRNIAIVGHGGEGKTTLTEAMLFNSGGTDRFGRVEDGTTTTDYDPEEIKRQISISSAIAPIVWKDHKINVVDVPGYFDFVGEMLGALRVVDSAVLVVGAVSGLMVGTEKAWDYCESHVIPRMIFINQMDRENANFSKVLDQLKDKYGTSIAPFQIPIMEGGKFKGIVDVLKMQAKIFDGKETKDAPIPDSVLDEVEPIRTMLIEAAVETSEELMEKYFEGEEITNEELTNAIRYGVLEGDIVPILCGSAVNNVGVKTLLDEVVNYLPSPCDRPSFKGTNPKTGETIRREMKVSEPFSALVFKTIVDPFIGKLSLFKVMSGELESGTTVYNANKDYNEKTTVLYTLKGKKQTQVNKLTAGDFGAFAKLQQTETGDTLCASSSPIVYKGIEFPEPAISMAILAEKEGEEDKVFAGLNRLSEEDPTFRIDTNTETNETLISGVGEMQLDVVASRLKSKFGVGVLFKEPKVAYRETIRKPIKAEGRHKKQSGGHGQYGHVWIEFEPLGDTEKQFEFVDKIVGGVVPRQYIPAVEKGLQESLPKGVLAGYPMVGIKATLYDGSYHSVDSSEMAFKMAAYLAYRKLVDADPVLLEPIMKAEVIVNDEYMGDVIGDLNRRRGRILGMNPIGNGLQCIEAEVPQAEMFKYATDLRSMTQARGSFKLTFVRYEEVPANISAKVVEQAKKEAE